MIAKVSARKPQATQAFAAIPANRDDQQPDRPDHTEHRERPHPAVPLQEPRHRQLRQDDHERVQEEEKPDPLLSHAGLVLGVDRQRFELSHPRSDEDEVEGDHGHEDTVPHNLAVPAPLASLGPRRSRRRRDSEQEDRVDEECRGVGQEQHGKRARVARRGDQSARQTAEADPEVHHHALHREGLVPLRLRSEAGDQGGLAGPEPAVPDPAIALARKPCHGCSTNA